MNPAQTLPSMPAGLVSGGSRSLRARAGNLVAGGGFRLVALTLLHFPLALLMYRLPVVATVHACAVSVLGVWWLFTERRPERVAYVAAYIVGAEVLWRMVRAEIYWEFGKYAVAALLGLGLLRYFRRWREAILPIGYFALLLPAVLLILGRLGLSEQTRGHLSFNLSGPLALAVAALYFSQLQVETRIIRSLFWSAIPPIGGIAFLALYNLATATAITFRNESNHATSGGFGPNQVSMSIGLGAALCLLAALLETRKSALFWFLISLMLWLLAQAALTFSRGGFYSAVLGVALAGIHYLREPRMRAAFLTATIVAVLVGGFFIAPRLNSYTGGMIGKRFMDSDSTSRTEIAVADLKVWMASPLLGVGPGMAREERKLMGYFGSQIAAHTELTRLLAEHGASGLLALAALMLMVWRAYWRATGLYARSYVAALTAWSLSGMMHAGMRVASISFVFGLAMCWWKDDESACAGKFLARARRPARPLTASARAD
jgi:O-antigen ligase